MLVIKIKDDVPAGDDLRVGVVVFNMVGPQVHATVRDFHVVVGDVKVADTALRAAGRNFSNRASGWV
jgi:hypothetical protein